MIPNLRVKKVVNVTKIGGNCPIKFEIACFSLVSLIIPFGGIVTFVAVRSAFLSFQLSLLHFFAILLLIIVSLRVILEFLVLVILLWVPLVRRILHIPLGVILLVSLLIILLWIPLQGILLIAL